MKYAILSDVHANDTALRYVLSDAFALGVERVVSLGDVVGYGPSPVEALRKVREVASVALAGNHDDAVAGRLDVKDFIDLAADAVGRHREMLATEDLAWLKARPYTAAIEGALCAHGDFTAPETFNYIDSPEAAAENFEATGAQLLFVGHTHAPGIYLVGASGEVHHLEPQNFTCENGKRYIVNVGSVGYPRARNGACVSAYVIYDSTARTVVFRFLPFVVSSVLQRGKSPKRLRTRVLVAAALLIALAAGALAFVLAPSETTVVQRVENVTQVTIARDPALRVATKALTLPKDARHVKAGLKLAKGDPVDLEIVFSHASGADEEPLVHTVKASANTSVKVPAGATSARFTVYRQQTNDAPHILTFTPTVVTHDSR